MNPMWAVKTRRAQTVEDNESWAMGGVVPTLNVFDNAHETRATVIVFYGNRVDDIRIQDDKINTLQARMGTGGNNMPMVYQEGEDETVAYSIREDAQADTFSATPTDTALALQAHQPSVQSHHAQLFIAQSFDTQFGSNANVFEDQSPTLKSTQQPPSVLAFDSYNQTLSETSQTLRAGTDMDKMGTVLTSTEMEVMPTLLAGMSHLTGTTQDGYIEKVHKMIATVRRLTPTECERLQGFPDGWTEGQADSHRYKQLGNAVAVPVVEWLIGRLKDSATSMESSTE
jgi:site-specific DNA-cytosine methylase